jgi:hypothetical protein
MHDPEDTESRWDNFTQAEFDAIYSALGFEINEGVGSIEGEELYEEMSEI